MLTEGEEPRFKTGNGEPGNRRENVLLFPSPILPVSDSPIQDGARLGEGLRPEQLLRRFF
jgi:hypothetical protein